MRPTARNPRAARTQEWKVELHDGNARNVIPRSQWWNAERDLLDSDEYQDFIREAEPGSGYSIEAETNKLELILWGFDWDRMCVTVYRQVRPASFEWQIPPSVLSGRFLPAFS